MKLLLILTCISVTASAQTMMTLEDCEQSFRKNNLLLLAEEYNIDAAEADVIQARIWQQPLLSAEINVYNPEHDKVFDAGRSGQKLAQLQQLIYIGGKKKSEVAFARSNVEVAKLEFERLLLTLRYELRQSYFAVYYDLRKTATTNQQLANLDSLVDAYARQAQRGNIPLKDVVRLQSLTFSIRNELVDIQRDVFSEQEKLKILCGVTSEILPSVNEQDLSQTYSTMVPYPLPQLQDMMITQNPESRLYQKLTERNDLFLQWQVALATPDVYLGGAYDQRGGAFQNQLNMTIGMTLPLWNRNKGNIKAARAEQERGRTLRDQKFLEMNSRIETVYKTLQFQQDQYTHFSTSSTQTLEEVYVGMIQNFQRRNVSLIEFTDFMESYHHSMIALNEIKKQIIMSEQQLNLLVNEDLF